MDISTQRATEPRLAMADLEIVILAGSLLCGRGCERATPFAQSAAAHNRTFGCLLLVLFRCARIFRMVPSCT